eukprot:3253999-Pleurochrysis_carterae.AAC.1
MYGRLRGNAGPAVELRGMMTGPRRSPNTSACGLDKAGLSANEGLRACAAVRRYRVQPGSQVAKAPGGEQLTGRVEGLRTAMHRLQLGRRERVRERRRNEGVKGWSASA